MKLVSRIFVFSCERIYLRWMSNVQGKTGVVCSLFERVKIAFNGVLLRAANTVSSPNMAFKNHTSTQKRGEPHNFPIFHLVIVLYYFSVYLIVHFSLFLSSQQIFIWCGTTYNEKWYIYFFNFFFYFLTNEMKKIPHITTYTNRKMTPDEIKPW